MTIQTREAHPRSRGENCGRRRPRASRPGSSPFTRGKLTYAALKPTGLRLIPAHAGKTARYFASGQVVAAHPRSRGENNTSRLFPRRSRGSSPLTRGKPILAVFADRQERLIPAHAGKTNKCGACLSHTPAHPRSRGENGFRGPRLQRGWGSSPLTRGKRREWYHWYQAGRLIPAHAGKTQVGVRVRAICAAHPRSRGENADSIRSISPVGGSSPLTRGKHGRVQRVHVP